MNKPFYSQKISDEVFIMTLPCVSNYANWICYWNKKTKTLYRVCTSRLAPKKIPLKFETQESFERYFNDNFQDISTTCHAGNNWRRKRWNAAFINLRLKEEGIKFKLKTTPEELEVNSEFYKSELKTKAENIKAQLLKLQEKYNVSIEVGTNSVKFIDNYAGITLVELK